MQIRRLQPAQPTLYSLLGLSASIRSDRHLIRFPSGFPFVQFGANSVECLADQRLAGLHIDADRLAGILDVCSVVDGRLQRLYYKGAEVAHVCREGSAIVYARPVLPVGRNFLESSGIL